MADHTIVLRLNQQQLQLIDRTIGEGKAANRPALIKRALVEHARKHLPSQAQSRKDRK